MTRWDKFRRICNDKELVAHFISNMAYDNEPTAQDILEFFNSEHNKILDWVVADSMDVFESTSKFRNMSTVDFVANHMGIKLNLYQKILLTALDAELRFEKKFFPYRYLSRVANWK